MPEQESIQTLEEEIHALEEKLAQRKAAEREGAAREEKEIFHDVLKEHIESAEEDVPKSDTGIPSLSQHDYTAQSRAKTDALGEKEHHEQVEALVEIALTKGILAAVNVARHLRNPHLLDDFHDLLIDEYYEKLVRARKIT